MWFIKNSQGDIIYLKPNKSMIVSRKDEYDIVLRNDASISKLHATITVRPKIEFKNNEPSSTVIVEDTGSKYGTQIIDSKSKPRKLTPGEHVVNSTDKIRFGLQHHIFTLHYVPFIVSTSTLTANEKVELRNIIDTLDGVITEKWQEYCTHLTVSNVTLTTQVVQALAFGTQIVSMKYWNAVMRSVEKNEQLPGTDNFVPTINEGSINKDNVSLKPNAERKVLFKGLVFVSFSASQGSLQDIIKCAGGKLVLFKENRLTMKQLSSKQVVVLQLSNSASEPSQASVAVYDSVQKSLQEKGHRLIPESEISLAILYCSIEKYCNPKFDFRRLIGTSNKNAEALSSTILEPDTEEVSMPTRRVRSVFIKESLTSSEQIEEQESQNTRKRKLSTGRKPTAEILKDSLPAAIGTKRILEKPNFPSEESSREGVLMIDETGSSIESDSNDATVKRRNFAIEFDEPIDKSKSSSSRARSDKKSKEQSPPKESILDTKADITKVKKTSTSTNVTDGQKSPKRNKPDEESMFSFVSEGAAKRKRDYRNDDEDDLFELLEDPNAKHPHHEENIFEKGLNKMKKAQPKRRPSSSSSNNSLFEEERPEIKVERSDSEGEAYKAPLIRCKKELDNSMDETCKSSIVPLLRTDIDLTLDNTGGNLKTFVKVYTSIPKQRIKLKNMYVWKSQDDSIKYESHGEELTSSDEEDDNFKFHSNKENKRVRARK